MIWTEAKVKQLLELAADHWPASHIAERIGTSRNAVIGKLHRLGIATKEHGMRHRLQQRKVRVPKPRAESEVVPHAKRAVPAHEHKTPPASTPEPARASKACTVMDLKLNSCRWPLDGNYYCGEQSVRNSPYCQTHFAQAYQQGTRREVRPPTRWRII